MNDTSAETLAAEKELLVSAKANLLAYDDTTFYAKAGFRRGDDGAGLGWLVQLWHR